MKKNYLILAILGIAAYFLFFKKKMSGARLGSGAVNSPAQSTGTLRSNPVQSGQAITRTQNQIQQGSNLASQALQTASSAAGLLSKLFGGGGGGGGSGVGGRGVGGGGGRQSSGPTGTNLTTQTYDNSANSNNDPYASGNPPWSGDTQDYGPGVPYSSYNDSVTSQNWDLGSVSGNTNEGDFSQSSGSDIGYGGEFGSDNFANYDFSGGGDMFQNDFSTQGP